MNRKPSKEVSVFGLLLGESVASMEGFSASAFRVGEANNGNLMYCVANPSTLSDISLFSPADDKKKGKIVGKKWNDMSLHEIL